MHVTPPDGHSGPSAASMPIQDTMRTADRLSLPCRSIPLATLGPRTMYLRASLGESSPFFNRNLHPN